jgi:hypothetical protein
VGTKVSTVFGLPQDRVPFARSCNWADMFSSIHCGVLRFRTSQDLLNGHCTRLTYIGDDMLALWLRHLMRSGVPLGHCRCLHCISLSVCFRLAPSRERQSHHESQRQ